MNLLRRIQYNSPVVLTFAGVSLMALILGYLTGGASTRLLFSAYRSSLLSPLTYVRMLGHVLGHGNYAHYMGNMLMILVIGPVLEEKYGSLHLLRAIAITAVVSAAANMLLFPGTAILGASGIVFMMIVLSSLAGMQEGRIPLTLILVVILYLGGEVLDGIFQRDNISQMTHILGGLCGAVIGFILERNRAGAGSRTS